MIVGITLSHNCTVSVVDEITGNVVYACSEERFSRRKNDIGFPYNSFQYVLDHIVAPENITKIAIGDSCRGKWSTKSFAKFMYVDNLSVKDKHIKYKLPLLPILAFELLLRPFKTHDNYQSVVRDILSGFNVGADVVFYDHHTCHAASTYYCSPYQDAYVVTMDGNGDGLSGSTWEAGQASLVKIGTIPESASVGKFYRAFTSIMGFRVNRHEGKVTGLAAYGDALKYKKQLDRFLFVDEQAHGNSGLVSLIAESYFKNFQPSKIGGLWLLKNVWSFLKSNTWEGLLNSMIHEYSERLFRPYFGEDVDFSSMQVKQDIAAAVQETLEDTVVSYIQGLDGHKHSSNLCLAGGVFSNVKLNQRILEGCEFENIYVHPGMGDEGLAVGAAMLAAHENAQDKLAQAQLDTVYLGAELRDVDIEEAIKNCGVQASRMSDDLISAHVVDALVKDKVVAICRGRGEYGPRALGHRTIMANPHKQEINDVVNARLNRTEFMPFAPVLTDEAYKTFFRSAKLDGAHHATRFMTITLDVQDELKRLAPGVVHVDGTARPQTVTQETEPLYFQIVEAFRKQTGIPCLVNTSFNVHEEPIVNSASDALKPFLSGVVDVLVLGHYVLNRDQE